MVVNRRSFGSAVGVTDFVRLRFVLLWLVQLVSLEGFTYYWT